jgi:hypothetical protein
MIFSRSRLKLAVRLMPRLVVAALCTILACPPMAFAEHDQRSYSSFEIAVGSRVGFFPSPGYTVTILGNGRVNYVGYDKVHWKGKQHGQVSQDAIEKLVATVRASNFFDLPGSYANGPCLSVDGSEGSLRIRLDGREKSVGTCNAPPIVEELMEQTVSAAKVWRWVIFDPGELRQDIAHGWSVPQHMPQIMEDAIDWDAAEIISILCANGADVNANHGAYLMRAITRDRVEAARALLDAGVNWKVEDPDTGETPAAAAAYHSTELTKLFLDRGADPNALSGADNTMLTNAVYLANLETVKLLINAKVDVNVRNKKGETALAIAENRKKEYSNAAPETAQSFQPVIDCLVAHGAIR